MSAEGNLERDFGVFNKVTQKGQEQLQARRIKLVDSLDTLETRVSSNTAKTKLAEIHSKMEATASDDAWQTSATLTSSKTKDLFTADNDAIRSLIDVPTDSVNDEDQAPLRAYIRGIVKFDGLIVAQLMDLNTLPVTNEQLWQQAWDNRLAGDVAYSERDYLGAPDLYEEAWDLSMKAIN